MFQPISLQRRIVIYAVYFSFSFFFLKLCIIISLFFFVSISLTVYECVCKCLLSIEFQQIAHISLDNVVDFEQKARRHKNCNQSTPIWKCEMDDAQEKMKTKTNVWKYVLRCMSNWGEKNVLGCFGWSVKCASPFHITISEKKLLLLLMLNVDSLLLLNKWVCVSMCL